MRKFELPEVEVIEIKVEAITDGTGGGLESGEGVPED